MCKVSEFEVVEYPNRDEWLAGRNRGIGASEVAAVMGLSSWASPYSLWARKRGLATDELANPVAASWGLKLERVVADEYELVRGKSLIDRGRWTVYRSKQTPCMIATLDREIADVNGSGPGCLEIKTARSADDWGEAPPMHYQMQLQSEESNNRVSVIAKKKSKRIYIYIIINS